MPRTTSQAVAALFQDFPTGGDAPDLTPFIEGSNALVTELCAAHYDATRLELIERWLAAHFYCVSDPAATFEGAEGVQASYESKVDLGLRITRYGQQAMFFDTGGYLAVINNAQLTQEVPLPAAGKRVRFMWLGRDRTCG